MNLFLGGATVREYFKKLLIKKWGSCFGVSYFYVEGLVREVTISYLNYYLTSSCGNSNLQIRNWCQTVNSDIIFRNLRVWLDFRGFRLDCKRDHARDRMTTGGVFGKCMPRCTAHLSSSLWRPSHRPGKWSSGMPASFCRLLRNHGDTNNQPKGL